MPNPIVPANLVIRETQTRMTPVPPSRRFGEVLAQGGRALLQSAVAMASFVPGGNILSAAIRGAPLPGAASNSVGASSSSPSLSGASPLPGAGSSSANASVEGPQGATSGSPGTAPGADDDMLARGQEMSMRMLRLQEAISEENRRYTALSNVLHARHEMAKNAIGNIR